MHLEDANACIDQIATSARGVTGGSRCVTSDIIAPSLTIAGTFNPSKSLKDLMAAKAENSTSYAISFDGGDPVPEPEPSTVVLVALGLGMVVFSLAGARRR